MREIQDKKENQKYLKDKRWRLIEQLAGLCKFGKANDILCKLRKKYGLKYR